MVHCSHAPCSVTLGAVSVPWHARPVQEQNHLVASPFKFCLQDSAALWCAASSVHSPHRTDLTDTSEYLWVGARNCAASIAFKKFLTSHIKPVDSVRTSCNCTWSWHVMCRLQNISADPNPNRWNCYAPEEPRTAAGGKTPLLTLYHLRVIYYYSSAWETFGM